MHPPDETIVAVATPPGRGGLAVIRLSGPGSVAIAGRLMGLSPDTRITPGHAILGWIRPAAGGRPLDRGYLTWHPAGRSYTGDDVVELSCHGSPVLARRIMEELVAAGARPAHPGEFTYRAVLNERLDLAQAEGVRDLIAAPTPAAAAAAMAQVRGDLSRRVRDMSETLAGIIARLEAALEFGDEPDVAGREPQAGRDLEQLHQRIDRFVASYRRGRLLREGARVVLAGRPNAGKSSLFNALLRHDRAIVSGEPGTTRDYVTERIDLDGIAVTLVDTAGLRDGADGVEGEGVAKTRSLLDQADLILLLCGCDEDPDARDAALLRDQEGRVVLVASKADLAAARGAPGWSARAAVVSAVTGEGLDALRDRIAGRLSAAPALGEEEITIGDARHHEALAGCSAALARAREHLAEGAPDELVLAELYDGLKGLGTITGEMGPDDIHERIFSTFCIGK